MSKYVRNTDKGTCVDSECEKPSYRRGYCTRCYKDQLLSGNIARPSIFGSNNVKWKGGISDHLLWDIYHDMIGRCRRESHQKYPDYGGRGIKVCQEWIDDFWQFVTDVGERPDESKTTGGRAYWQLDRINNDGNYEPGNVRWATPVQQAGNKRGHGDSEYRRDLTTGRYLTREEALKCRESI